MKEILKTLIDNNYDAYVIGGFVRDKLLGIDSNDIDICTNASIDEISLLFNGKGKEFKEYFSYHIIENRYSYDITSYRKEISYNNSKPNKIELCSSLSEDIKRRDFTINAIAMDINENIYDYVNGIDDLNNKIIRCIGNTNNKFIEDNTRILRAIRFACTLGFKFSNEIISFLSSEKSSIISNINREYLKKELDIIFDSKNALYFFDILNKYNINKYFNIKYDNIKKSYNKYGYFYQITYDFNYTRHEKKIFKEIDYLLNNEVSFKDFSNYNIDSIYNAYYFKYENNFNYIKELLLNRKINIDISIKNMLEYLDIKDILEKYRIIEEKIEKGIINNNKCEILNYLRSL